MNPLLLKHTDVITGACRRTAVALFFIVSFFHSLTAQDILLKNPSLEGSPRQGKVPEYWDIATGTPDIQPGVFNIVQPASDGKSYIGLHSGALWPEGITQMVDMKGGHSYALSFDLAYTAFYAYAGCYGNMAIYGGDKQGDTTELLWRSGPFYHTSWKKYNAVISPSRDYKYISFLADGNIDCEKSAYGSIVLIDNLSSSLREIPQVIISVENTCKGKDMGVASAKVIGNAGPYTYSWMPGGQTTSRIDHLPYGNYQVTVISSNGTSTTATITVKEIELKSTVTVTLSGCYGEAKNQINISTQGGMAPYRFYLNDAILPSYSPDFKELKAGNYSVTIRDDMGCEAKLLNIKVNEPPPLQITTVSTADITCSETTDGRIEVAVTGGKPPYLYKMEASDWQGDKFWKQLNEGRYYFVVKDQNNCVSRGSAEIFRNQRACAVYVPTAFTPNGDGQNDLFRIRVNDDISNYKLTIYNRWGVLVFLSNDPRAGWDGAKQQGGCYAWMLTYTDSKKQMRKQLGNLILIR